MDTGIKILHFFILKENNKDQLHIKVLNYLKPGSKSLLKIF